MSPRSVAQIAAGAALAALGLAGGIARAQSTDSAADASLDSLLGLRISAASKYAQTSREAPASVTILTADDLRLFGYRNLQEALESVRGFYVSSDRNYVYLGTRGFSRPTDYNNRVVLLVDGHTTNEQVWGAAEIAGVPFDLDAVERIEVVRGPGSALYGTSAMFAVINIVTKSGAALDGISATGRVGTGRARESAIAAGHTFAGRGTFALSGLASHTDGRSLYFPEFDAPETNRGIARDLDWESGASLLATLGYGDVTARAGYGSRGKGIPTAAFSTAFNDPSAETVDRTMWVELSARREIGAAHHLSARVYGDQYRYRGVYPGDSGTYIDRGASTDVGGEAMLIWDPSSRDRVTVGTEVRHVSRAWYWERQQDGFVTSDDAPFDVGSLFAQNELQLSRALTLVGGLRLEKRSRTRAAAAPRIALIATPDRQTTLKLLYGEAFRAPTPAEADLSTSFYERNPALGPERIRTIELELQRRVTAPVLVGVSVYDYHIRDLIDQVSYDEASGVQYRNVEASTGAGIEAQVDVQPGGPLSARATYEIMRSEDESDGTRLTNSPAHTGSLAAMLRGWSGLRSAVTARYESGRRTVVGTSTSSFVRTDLNVGYAVPAASGAAWLRGADLSVRITNLFDVRYAVPGGLEHLQASIPQDGRAISVRLGWQL
jgi:outer membrane cobalamin receptor